MNIIARPIGNEVYNTIRWNELPGELVRDIGDCLPFRDIYNASYVCKAWRGALLKLNSGSQMLATVGVEPSSENWISQCKRFVETPQVLAMDISALITFWVNP